MDKPQRKLLIIEDDGSLRKLYVDLFEQAGFLVDQAVEGREGAEKLHQGGYDLVLIDILLPGLSGDAVLAEIASNPPLENNGPIIMLTNQDQEEIHQKCLNLGAAGIIVKSKISLDQLLPKVEKYLNSDQYKEQQ